MPPGSPRPKSAERGPLSITVSTPTISRGPANPARVKSVDETGRQINIGNPRTESFQSPSNYSGAQPMQKVQSVIQRITRLTAALQKLSGSRRTLEVIEISPISALFTKYEHFLKRYQQLHCAAAATGRAVAAPKAAPKATTGLTCGFSLYNQLN